MQEEQIAKLKRRINDLHHESLTLQLDALRDSEQEDLSDEVKESLYDLNVEIEELREELRDLDEDD